MSTTTRFQVRTSVKPATERSIASPDTVPTTINSSETSPPWRSKRGAVGEPAPGTGPARPA